MLAASTISQRSITRADSKACWPIPHPEGQTTPAPLSPQNLATPVQTIDTPLRRLDILRPRIDVAPIMVAAIGKMPVTAGANQAVTIIQRQQRRPLTEKSDPGHCPYRSASCVFEEDRDTGIRFVMIVLGKPVAPASAPLLTTSQVPAQRDGGTQNNDHQPHAFLTLNAGHSQVRKIIFFRARIQGLERGRDGPTAPVARLPPLTDLEPTEHHSRRVLPGTANFC